MRGFQIILITVFICLTTILPIIAVGYDYLGLSGIGRISPIHQYSGTDLLHHRVFKIYALLGLLSGITYLALRLLFSKNQKINGNVEKIVTANASIKSPFKMKINNLLFKAADIWIVSLLLITVIIVFILLKMR